LIAATAAAGREGPIMVSIVAAKIKKYDDHSYSKLS
jgi:hypothetical protein